jgi:uncharacterized protein
MTTKIQNDYSRFRQIVRGKIKDNLKKYISSGELLAQQGKKKISIPLPQIQLPRFQFDPRDVGGVGQGPGQVGASIDPAQGEECAEGHAGSGPGEHAFEVDITFEELADLLGEELELPKVEPKSNKKMSSDSSRYTGIQRVGPDSLRHFKRTFKQALRRQLMMGQYNPQSPVIVPSGEDKRYRSWKIKEEPQANAVIIYLMDVSGSMGEEQKEIVRIESFWLDTWLRSQYKDIQTRYVIHDAMAKEVDRETFFHTRESGGTMISSAYKLCAEIIRNDYPSSEWNIYPFHFSDGDNWSADDTRVCLDILREQLLPVSNVFCYGQVESPYGSGQFIKDLRAAFAGNDQVLTSEIPNKEAIQNSIKDFLGPGK